MNKAPRYRRILLLCRINTIGSMAFYSLMVFLATTRLFDDAGQLDVGATLTLLGLGLALSAYLLSTIAVLIVVVAKNRSVELRLHLLTWCLILLAVWGLLSAY